MKDLPEDAVFVCPVTVGRGECRIGTVWTVELGHGDDGIDLGGDFEIQEEAEQYAARVRTILLRIFGAMGECGETKMNKIARLYDKNQRPIQPGDLLRTFHFQGARRKKHYLYHVVVATTDGYDMVPVSHLEPTKAVYGGRCRLDKARAREVEIIYGNGPPPFLSFEGRPRRRGAK